jgi:hypothetical protein
MNLKDLWIRFIYNFAWFSKVYFSLTMKISKNLTQCVIPIFSDTKQITQILNYGKLYKNDNVGEIIKDYLIHPRVIQCRLQNKQLFGDCDDHAIYWCTALKKSNLAKKVWFSIYSMKARWPDDTYSAHAVCVFQGHDEKFYWCDYQNPNLIEKIEDFQIKSANLYGCDAICGSIWEIIDIKNDDTPIFGKITKVLPSKK